MTNRIVVRRRILSALLLTAFLPAAVNSQETIKENQKQKSVALKPTRSTATSVIQWSRNLRAAAKRAEKLGKPLYINVTSANCVHCKRQKASTYKNKAVIQQINDRYIAVEVDAPTNQDLVKILKVRMLPTHVFVAPNLDVLARHSGFQTAAQLSTRLKKHANKKSSRSTQRTADGKKSSTKKKTK